MKRTLAVFVLLWSSVSTVAADGLRVGFAVADVTPPPTYRMAGSYSEHAAEGVLDPILAKAIYLEQGTTKACLIVVDVCGHERGLVKDVREAISKSTGVPVDHVSLSATHTHGGPMHYDPVLKAMYARSNAAAGTPDRHDLGGYPKKFTAGCITAGIDAWKNAKPAAAASGIGKTAGIAFNRRYRLKNGSYAMNPGKLSPSIAAAVGPTDPDLPFVLFRDVAGKPFGSLCSFAMHTTVYGGMKFSADHPASLQASLRTKFGADFVSLYGEGCAGDVNQIDTSVGMPEPAPDVYGAKLAAALLAAEPTKIETPMLKVRVGSVDAPLRANRPNDLEVMRDRLSGPVAAKTPFLDKVEAYRVLMVDHMRTETGPKRPLPVQVFTLGTQTAIVTLPHEVFVELGLEIRRRSPYPHTMIVTIANEVDVYVPTKKAFSEGSYEVVNSPYEPGVGELLVEEAVRLLHESRK